MHSPLPQYPGTIPRPGIPVIPPKSPKRFSVLLQQQHNASVSSSPIQPQLHPPHTHVTSGDAKPKRPQPPSLHHVIEHINNTPPSTPNARSLTHPNDINNNTDAELHSFLSLDSALTPKTATEILYSLYSPPIELPPLRMERLTFTPAMGEGQSPSSASSYTLTPTLTNATLGSANGSGSGSTSGRGASRSPADSSSGSKYSEGKGNGSSSSSRLTFSSAIDSPDGSPTPTQTPRGRLSITGLTVSPTSTDVLSLADSLTVEPSRSNPAGVVEKSKSTPGKSPSSVTIQKQARQDLEEAAVFLDEVDQWLAYISRRMRQLERRHVRKAEASPIKERRREPRGQRTQGKPATSS
ncbi:hypothetical protein DFP72DRAFT_849747 [Ephemerocybe angulata]|uniref:Uncharacterized protein n=1 Tax=Ephemerocybe angulata TaxID=980116 RepID=A0A8H6M573_9AGAR|nr:hypothetical protein DFP72DRAFT_849747 [Tulosesus angulatus]